MYSKLCNKRWHIIKFVICGRLRNSKTGFTLIELLLVLVLLGVFAGFVVPQVGGLFFDSEIKSTVASIEKMFSYAEKAAVLDGRNYCVKIDANENNLKLYCFDNSETSEKYVAVSGKIGKELNLPDSVSLELLAEDEYFFFPDGSSTEGSFSLRSKNDILIEFSVSKKIHGFKIEYRN